VNFGPVSISTVISMRHSWHQEVHPTKSAPWLIETFHLPLDISHPGNEDILFLNLLLIHYIQDLGSCD